MTLLSSLSPQAETILVVMAGLEDYGDGGLHTDDIAWALRTHHGAPEKPEARLPGRAPESWFFRHRKGLEALGLARFSRNGYGQGLSPSGRELVGQLRAFIPSYAPSPYADGAALLDWQPASDRRVYENGRVIQRTRLCWMPIALGTSSRGGSGRVARLADGADPKPGMRLARCSAVEPYRRDDALARPALGTLVRVVGPWAWLDVGGPGDLVAHRLSTLIEIGRPDTTGLSEHQRKILDRLARGTAVIAIRSDGSLTVKSTPDAREGHVHCLPQSLDALARSGAIAHLIEGAR